MTPIHGDSMYIAEVAVAKKPDWSAVAANRGNIVQMFFNVNLVKSHRGLNLIAHEYDIDLGALEPGQFVCFLNRAKNRIKLYTAGNIYAYLALPERNQQVTMEIIGQIPRMFLSKAELNYLPIFEEALERPLPLAQANTPARRRTTGLGLPGVAAGRPQAETARE
jgi:hypothetical protein